MFFVFDVNNVGVKHPQWFMPDEFVNLMNAPPSSLCLRTINPPIVIGPDEPYDAPSYIILTPVMVYDFDIMKSPSTKSLPGFPLDIRFPTLIPLLDGLYYGWENENTYSRRTTSVPATRRVSLIEDRFNLLRTDGNTEDDSDEESVEGDDEDERYDKEDIEIADLPF